MKRTKNFGITKKFQKHKFISETVRDRHKWREILALNSVHKILAGPGEFISQPKFSQFGHVLVKLQRMYVPICYLSKTDNLTLPKCLALNIKNDTF